MRIKERLIKDAELKNASAGVMLAFSKFGDWITVSTYREYVKQLNDMLDQIESDLKEQWDEEIATEEAETETEEETV